MPIDKITANIYTCCKCQYTWLGGWDSKNNKESPIPFYCPKCKNFRWDQEYTKEEDSLFDKVQEQHTVERVKEESEYERLIAQLKGQGHDATNIMITVKHIDFIAYDFLFEIRPQPDMFELKHLLAIPMKNIEARHEFMLSVILDRIDNADRHEKERFSKYSEWSGGHNKRSHGYELSEPKRKSEKMVKGCKHTIKQVQKLEKVIEQKRDARRKKIEDERQAKREQWLEKIQEQERELEELREKRERLETEKYHTVQLQEKAKKLEQLEMQRNKTE